MRISKTRLPTQTAAALVGAGAMILGLSPAALAAGPPNGVPGQPNCVGSSIAYNNNQGFGGKAHVGVGEVANLIDQPGITTRFLIDYVKDGCGR